MSDNDVLDADAVVALAKAVSDGQVPRLPEMIRIAFTGTMSMSRNDMFALVVAFGGQPVTTVTQRTRYLVAADPHSGSTKVRAARRYGIPIFSETAFIERLLAGDLARA